MSGFMGAIGGAISGAIGGAMGGGGGMDTGAMQSGLDSLNSTYAAAQQFELAVTEAKTKGDAILDAVKQRPNI